MSIALVAYSDRAAEQVTLRATKADLNGDQGEFFTLPSGFGDCLIIDASVKITAIATFMANPELAGPFIQLFDSEAAASPRDIAFSKRWIRYNATALGAYLTPDQLQMWKGDEAIRLDFMEVDTNAAPTADLELMIKVRRIRQTGPRRMLSA